jgi:hypothetical protein
MANYKIKLTPNLINLASEGSLDTAVSGGVSLQRGGYFDVYNGANRKIVSHVDGTTFTDTIPTWTTNDNIVAL